MYNHFITINSDAKYYLDAYTKKYNSYHTRDHNHLSLEG